MSIALVQDLTAELLVVGASLSTDIADRVTSWEFVSGVERYTELGITLTDPDLTCLHGGAPLARGARVEWRDLDLVVSELGVQRGPAGAEVRFAAHSRGVQALRRATGDTVWSSLSPTDLIRSECGKVGLKVVAEETAGRAQIARAAKPGDRTPDSTWDIFDRVAGELGFWLFESEGTVFFGRPSWLLARSGETTHRWQWPRPGTAGPDEHVLQDVPECHGTDDAPDATVTAPLLSDDAILYRPGHAVIFSGIPGFAGTYLTTEVSIRPDELLGEVEVATPVDPTPTTNPDGSPLAGTGSGSAAVEAFVAKAMAQAGDRYVWGAGRTANGDPDAFDCSGLVYWAATQVGVPRVASTAEGLWSQCKSAGRLISVADGVRTRGALLFHGSGIGSGRQAITHVAISLGDGHTIEARGSRYGVGVFAAERGFDFAGLLPGLSY